MSGESNPRSTEGDILASGRRCPCLIELRTSCVMSHLYVGGWCVRQQSQGCEGCEGNHFTLEDGVYDSRAKGVKDAKTIILRWRMVCTTAEPRV